MARDKSKEKERKQAGAQAGHYMLEMELFKRFRRGNLREKRTDRRTGRERRCRVEFVEEDHRSGEERRSYAERRTKPPEKVRSRSVERALTERQRREQALGRRLNSFEIAMPTLSRVWIVGYAWVLGKMAFLFRRRHF